MSIDSDEELEGLLRIGRIVAEALREMEGAVEPGVTTRELDGVARRVLKRHGATATPRKRLGFPAYSCVSINDEAVHGVPGTRVIRDGDLVKIDVTADLDGFVADAARTVFAGTPTKRNQRLARCARQAFDSGLRAAVAGKTTRDIGRAVGATVRRGGFTVLRELFGHGVGRAIHESPSVPNYDEPKCRDRLTQGLVITVEPIISTGSPNVTESRDGWTLRTRDGSPSAHHEETIVITRGKPIIVTALD